MNQTPFSPEENEFRISYTGSIADAAPNEAENVEQLNAILRERPLNERRRRARRAFAADAVLCGAGLIVDVRDRLCERSNEVGNVVAS